MNAVKDAEAATSGEIVPYVVEQCDRYEVVAWRCAMAGGLLASAVSLLYLERSTWPVLTAWELSLAVLAVLALGWAAGRYVPWVKRVVAGHALIDRRIAQRAAEAFVAEEVFNTRDRTGILIFLSLMERRVIVLGDAGINSKVKPAEWEDVVNVIVQGIKEGRPADGLVAGIGKAGALLHNDGVARRPDDTDELPDALRMSDT